MNKEKLKGVFDKLDKDKSGTIEVDEIKKMFKYHEITDKALGNIMKEYDLNGDGVI